MKPVFAIVAVGLALLCGAARAAGGAAVVGTISATDQVLDGTLNVSNVSHEARMLVRLSYALPSGGLTNTLTLSQIRKFQLPSVVYTNVTTNSVIASGSAGHVETNYFRPQRFATMTNSYSFLSTNTTAVQVYDRDDFGDCWMFEPSDRTEFRFTESNTFYMIRVYGIDPRGLN